MLTRTVLTVAIVVAVIAFVWIPLRLAAKTPVPTGQLAGIKTGLLSVAGVLSAFTALMAAAAAAWGMDTRLPWGLGIYMYLIPVLSLPAFLLLFVSVRSLSRFLWMLTILNPPASYFGDRADRIASHMQVHSDPLEILGMFLNVLTILLVMISVIVQMAALCERRREKEAAALGQSI